MEHLIIETKPHGYFRITAEAGYELYCENNQSYYSEALTKSTKGFKAIPIE